MYIEPKLKDRLMKLLALSKSGNQHESASAQSRIEKLCKLHNVDINVLLDADEAVEMHWFKYTDPYSEKVLAQTIFRVTNIWETWHNKRRPNQLGVNCTKSQAAEIALWWSVMGKAFLLEMAKMLGDLASAFTQANNLYGNEDALPEREYTAEERARACRAAMLAEQIEPTEVLKRLE